MRYRFSYRRYSGWLLFLMIFMMTACQPAQEPEKEDLNAVLTELIGQGKETVEEKLADISIEIGERNEVTEIIGSRQYLGYDFTIELLFDFQTDQLYGYRYTREYPTEKMEDAVNDFRSVFDRLVEQHGESSTYEGLDNRYLESQDIAADLESKGSLLERWDLQEHEDYQLSAVLDHMEEDSVKIILTYRIQLIPAVS